MQGSSPPDFEVANIVAQSQQLPLVQLYDREAIPDHSKEYSLLLHNIDAFHGDNPSSVGIAYFNVTVRMYCIDQ